MPIMTKVEDVFPSLMRGAIWRVHNKAMLFGIIVPIYLVFIVRISVGNVFGVWPTVFSTAFEHAIIFGWAGLYFLGLIYFVLPEILDKHLVKSEYRKFYILLSLYAFGAMLTILAPILGSLLNASSSYIFQIIGSLFEIAAWIAGILFLIKLSPQKAQGFESYYRLLLLSTVIFLAALLLVPVLIIYFQTFDLNQLGLFWKFFLRFLPVVSFTIMLLVFITRLFPEMLGWRPIEEKRFHIVMSIFILGFLFLLVGYPWFHKDPNLANSIVYGIGAFSLLVGFIVLFFSLDFWKVRLSATASKEHVKFLYAGLVWFMLLLINFVFYVTWEISNQTLTSGHWSSALFHSALVGFIGQSLIGLYIYIINATKGSYQHPYTVMETVFVMINLAIFFRLFLYPLLIGLGWTQATTMVSALNIVVFIAILLASIDMAYGLNGKRLIKFRD